MLSNMLDSYHPLGHDVQWHIAQLQTFRKQCWVTCWTATNISQKPAASRIYSEKQFTKTEFPWNKVHCSSLEHICNSNINNRSAIFQCRVSGKELQGLKMYLMTQIEQNITDSNNEWQYTSVGFEVLITVFLKAEVIWDIT